MVLLWFLFDWMNFDLIIAACAAAAAQADICYWCCRNYLFTPHNSHITEIALRWVQLCILCICAHHSFQLLHSVKHSIIKFFFSTFYTTYLSLFLSFSLSHPINSRSKIRNTIEKFLKQSNDQKNFLGESNTEIKRSFCLASATHFSNIKLIGTTVIFEVIRLPHHGDISF